MLADPFQGLKSLLRDTALGHIPLLERGLFAVLDMLSSPITGIKTRFHWLQIVEALLLTALVFAFARGALGTGVHGFLRYAFPKGAYGHPSSIVDYKLNLVNYFTGSFFNLTWRLSTPFMTAGVVAALVAVFGPPAAPLEWGVVTFALFLVALWFIDDLGYYLAHYAAHKIPFLWAFHKVHHSAELLTIFTAGRVHPMEYAFIAPTRSATAALVLGPAVYVFGSEPTLATWYGIGLWVAVSGALGEQLLHSHVWLSWGRFWDKIILSPALHQIHHSSEPRHWDTNFAGRFSIWDWLFGTLYQPNGHETFRYGIYGEPRQLHPGLVSAYLRPYWDLVPAKAWLLTRAARILGPWVDDVAARWMLLPTPKPPIAKPSDRQAAAPPPGLGLHGSQPGTEAPSS